MAKRPYKIVDLGNPKVIALEFKSAMVMAMMFMRFQEYTEGIKAIRNRVMPEGDMLYNYWRKRKSIYYKDGFLGFNIRGDMFVKILAEFHSREINLNSLEYSLVDEVYGRYGGRTVSYLQGDFYVIAWVRGKGWKKTKKHEWYHAIYYLNPEYRIKVINILDAANLKKASKVLRKHGYAMGGPQGAYILKDEVQAYLGENDKEIKKAVDKPTRKALRKLAKEYCSYSDY